MAANTTLMGLTTKTPAAPIGPVQPLSAAAASPLSGADYYKNLAANGTAAEKVAAQNWLKRNTPTTSTTTKTTLPGLTTSGTTPTTPVAPTTPTTPQYYNPMTRALTPEGMAAGKPDLNAPAISKPGPIVNPLTGSATTPTGPDTSRAGLLTTAAGMATKTPEMVAQINKDLTQIKANIQKSKENYAKARTDLYAEPGGITLKEGRDRLLQEQYRMEQSALSEQANALADQLGAATTTFGTQSGLIQGALGQQQPTQIGPESTLITQEGTPIYGFGAGGTGANTYKNWSNYQFNTKAAQDKGAEAADMQVKTGLVSTQWNNLKGIMDKFGMNTDARLINATVNVAKSVMGDAQYKEFDTAYEGLKNTIESIMELPNVSPNNSNWLQTVLTQLNNKSLQISALEGVARQVINIGNQTANAVGSQAEQYDQAGTGTVIGKGNVQTPTTTPDSVPGGTINIYSF